MNKSDHITALFMGGLYYWLVGDKQLADLCWRTGVDVLHNFPFQREVGQA